MASSRNLFLWLCFLLGLATGSSHLNKGRGSISLPQFCDCWAMRIKEGDGQLTIILTFEKCWKGAPQIHQGHFFIDYNDEIHFGYYMEDEDKHKIHRKKNKTCLLKQPCYIQINTSQMMRSKYKIEIAPLCSQCPACRGYRTYREMGSLTTVQSTLGVVSTNVPRTTSLHQTWLIVTVICVFAIFSIALIIYFRQRGQQSGSRMCLLPQSLTDPGRETYGPSPRSPIEVGLLLAQEFSIPKQHTVRTLEDEKEDLVRFFERSSINVKELKWDTQNAYEDINKIVDSHCFVIILSDKLVQLCTGSVISDITNQRWHGWQQSLLKLISESHIATHKSVYFVNFPEYKQQIDKILCKLRKLFHKISYFNIESIYEEDRQLNELLKRVLSENDKTTYPTESEIHDRENVQNGII